MKDVVSLYGKWALIAGAAQGIGAAFSTALAEMGMNLVLIDHDPESLTLLSGHLETKYKITTECIHRDLTEASAASDCLGRVKDIDFRLLIYVPAFSPIGKFVDFPEEEIGRFISLNVATPLHMVHAFLNNRKKDQRYGIILMSSLAGMVGPALAATYAGTKAFSLIFSEALFNELKGEKVDILACCAGPTSTPTYLGSHPENGNRLITVMNPGDVARYALTMLGKKSFCIPGLKNRIFYFILTRLLSRKRAGNLVSNSMKKMYPGF